MPEVAGLWVGSAPGKCRMSPAHYYFAQNTADSPTPSTVSYPRRSAKYRIEQLGPDAAPLTLEALATLKHLQSLDMP